MNLQPLQAAVVIFGTSFLGINAAINELPIKNLDWKALATTYSNSRINKKAQIIVGGVITVTTLIQINCILTLACTTYKISLPKKVKKSAKFGFYHTIAFFGITTIVRNILNIKEIGLQTLIQTSSPITKKLKILSDIILISLAIHNIYCYVIMFIGFHQGLFFPESGIIGFRDKT